VELHTLRGRLLAGCSRRPSRAIGLALPAGLLRLDDGQVVKDPDLAVQHAIMLVFQTFLWRKSASQVVRVFHDQGLHLPRRHRNGETLWRTPTVAAVVSLLRNPADAGTFVYGKPCMQPRPGGARAHHHRQPQAAWKVIVHDRYPASITWETFTRIQAILDDNYATSDRHRPRGVPRQGAALLQGIVYGGICGHKMVVPWGPSVSVHVPPGADAGASSVNVCPRIRSISTSSPPSCRPWRP
jgi:hypothetical protein